MEKIKQWYKSLPAKKQKTVKVLAFFGTVLAIALVAHACSGGTI